MRIKVYVPPAFTLGEWHVKMRRYGVIRQLVQCTCAEIRMITHAFAESVLWSSGGSISSL